MAQVYTITVKDGKVRPCPTCATTRPIYQFIEDGERLTCCAFCSRVHVREAEKP